MRMAGITEETDRPPVPRREFQLHRLLITKLGCSAHVLEQRGDTPPLEIRVHAMQMRAWITMWRHARTSMNQCRRDLPVAKGTDNHSSSRSRAHREGSSEATPYIL